jgi:microcystin-dependent protein
MDDSGTIGEIKLFPSGGFNTDYWWSCNGALIQINGDTDALYSVIGVKYGGDGFVTFELPKLTPPEGMQYAICWYGTYPESK